MLDNFQRALGESKSEGRDSRAIKCQICYSTSILTVNGTERNQTISLRSMKTQHTFIDTGSRKLKQDGRCSFQETSKVTFFNYTRKRRRAKDNVPSIRERERKLLADGCEMARVAVFHLLLSRKD
jgi:hypothetical protein